MKKIIYSLVFAITLSVGGFIFISNRFGHTNQTVVRAYIICKTLSKDSEYPFEITMPKGSKAIDIARILFKHPGDIYIKRNKTWHGIKSETKIYNDVVMKA